MNFSFSTNCDRIDDIKSEIKMYEDVLCSLESIMNSIRKLSCNWYKSISSKELDVWELSTWDEIKALETLYFQVQCYHKVCEKEIKLNLLKSKLPNDIIDNIIFTFL